MTWFWHVTEGLLFLGMACALAAYTGRPIWVFVVFLILAAWGLVRSINKGGW